MTITISALPTPTDEQVQQVRAALARNEAAARTAISAGDTRACVRALEGAALCGRWLQTYVRPAVA